MISALWGLCCKAQGLRSRSLPSPCSPPDRRLVVPLPDLSPGSARRLQLSHLTWHKQGWAEAPHLCCHQTDACVLLVVLTSVAKIPRYISSLGWFARPLTFPVSRGSLAPQAPGQMRTLPSEMLCHCLFTRSLAVTQEHLCAPGLNSAG